MERYPIQKSSNDVRLAFRESVQQLVETIERVPQTAWGKQGLGEWTVRELTAHVVRIVDRTAAYAVPRSSIDTENGAAYYAKALSTPNINEDIAVRARQSVAILGDDPAEAARRISNITLKAIDELDDATPMVTPFGTVRLIDYLETRVLEFVIHGQDISRATDVPLKTTRAALTTSLHLLSEIAEKRGKGTEVALALTGRLTSPEKFNVLG